jgi:hypothetical protein
MVKEEAFIRSYDRTCIFVQKYTHHEVYNASLKVLYFNIKKWQTILLL